MGYELFELCLEKNEETISDTQREKKKQDLAGKSHELWNSTCRSTEIVLRANKIHTVCDMLEGWCASV